jgi:hypothetical protein
MTTGQTIGPGTGRFASFASLRAEHSRLLKRNREEAAPDLLDEAEAFLRRGQATGALLDRDEDRWAAQSFLDYWAAILYRAGRRPPQAILDDFDPTLAPALDDKLCPYVGLDAFRLEDTGVFFGREGLISELVHKLKENRLLAIVGPSGSGKSSVMLAGVLPSLKKGALPGSETWHYYDPIVPGSNPLLTLVRLVLGETRETPGEVEREYRQMLADRRRLTAVVGATTMAPAVIAIDQFEELFTLCADDQIREAFAGNLQALVEAPGPRHAVILTLRSDFESYIARLPGLQPLFERGQMRVTPLSAAQLREAIEKPADIVGLRFEDGVVNTLVREILGEPAGLPLLQFTLRKLWQSRERNRVTMEAYRRLGGGRMALAKNADEFYRNLIPEDQVTAKRILLRMVRPGEGLEVTSNPISRASLYASGEANDRIDRVLAKLIEAQLVRERVVPGEGAADLHIELAHEALVRNWPMLVAWLEEERATLRKRLRLTAAAEQWAAHGKDPGGLMGGSLLEEAQAYGDLNDLEREFVLAGVEAQRAAERDKEDAHLRELAQARALAAEQQRRAEIEAASAAKLRRRSMVLAVMFGIAIIGCLATIVSTIFAFARMRDAQQATRVAEEATRKAVVAAEIAEGERMRAEQALANEVELRKRATAAENAKVLGGTTTVAEFQSAIRSFEAQAQEADQLKASISKWQEEIKKQRPELEEHYSRLAAISALAQVKTSREQNARATAAAGAARYDFKLWIEAPPEVMNRISTVEYHFNHPSFQQRLIRSGNRDGFRVSYTGWGCLCSVIVTFIPVDPKEQPSTTDFAMCSALGTECRSTLTTSKY